MTHCLQISIAPYDVGRMLALHTEHPVTFTIGRTDEYGNVVLVHLIDGSPTTLLITLKPDGTWSALKNVEV